MKKFLIFGLILIVSISIQFVSTQEQQACKNNDYDPVDIDLNSYFGRWYEIYVTKNVMDKFEKGCKCTYAEYGPINPTRISVNNYCYNTEKGKKDGIEGYADVLGPGQLNVTFFWWQVWTSPYTVVYIGGDYEVAIIFSCFPYRENPILKYFATDFVWVLSKTPELSDKQLEDVQAYLSSKSISFDDFAKTEQNTQFCKSQY